MQMLELLHMAQPYKLKVHRLQLLFDK